MKVVNLTPHTLNVHNNVGDVSTFEPSGQVARVQVSYEPAGEVAGLPVSKAVYGEVEGLPEPQEGIIYIVSGMVQARVPRSDVFAPGDLVRDEEGRPVGCRGLKQ